MKSKGLLLAAMAMAMKSESKSENSKIQYISQEINKEKSNETPVPFGFKRFYFNEDGECLRGEHTIYFDAIKRSYAYFKFERWQNMNNG